MTRRSSEPELYEDESPIMNLGFVVQNCRFNGFTPHAPEVVEVDGEYYVRRDLAGYSMEDEEETEIEE